jgi:hypothetical protein
MVCLPNLWKFTLIEGLMTITNATRLFNPLSGKELKKIMMDDFERMLDESQYFMEHLSFSLADVQINVSITSNPPLFNDILLERRRRLETDDANELPTEASTVTFGGIRNNVGMVPDAEREAHELPLTEKVRDEQTGVFFDQSVTPTEAVRHETTVGGGTRPRGTNISPEKVKKAAQGSANLEEPMLDDEGQEIKING